MKVAAMKLAISEIRSQICRGNVKILVKWFIQNTTLTSLLDYLGLNISWGLDSGDDCRRMIPWKWHRRRKVFFCSFGADKNPLTMPVVEVSACCSNVCIENFVRLFELTVSSNGEGIAVVGRWQVSFQTTSYCLHCIPWIVIATRVSGYLI